MDHARPRDRPVGPEPVLGTARQGGAAAAAASAADVPTGKRGGMLPVITDAANLEKAGVP